jgi:hypothetical protein
MRHRRDVNPGAQRLVADTELPGHPSDHTVVTGVLASELEDHAHGALLQFIRIPLLGTVSSWHSSILASKVWSLYETQAGSSRGRR